MALKLPIFMDYHSTTPVDPRVLEAMLPYFTTSFGNAASRNHSFGWVAEKAVDDAREQIGKLIGASGKELVFTSGATESNNLALKGAAHFYKDRGNHIITTQIEHKSVLDTCKRLELEGFEVTYLPVEADGQVRPEAVRAAMTDRTILVSVMLANNEIGTIQPLKEIGQIVKERGALLHSDAVQGIGKIPFDVSDVQADLVSLTAHKIYGPKGVGALYVRRKPRVRLEAQIDGGGHERGLRSGTLNVPGIVGFGKACEVAMQDMAVESARIAQLRDRLESRLMQVLPHVFRNGSVAHRLPGNANLSFAYVEGEGLLMALKDVAVSSGSACTSASLEPSYVLRALGIGEELAHTSIRYGLGRFTTEEEVDFVVKLTTDKVQRLREMSPLWEMVQEGVDLKSIEWSAAH
ncbi:MAG: IscS subfamily cysteine desulfurase [Deltaproteobacteria bacterium]|nr:IscS subfamily cysteine desulfurase [Deltaproteobacteria bacterium]